MVDLKRKEHIGIFICLFLVFLGANAFSQKQVLTSKATYYHDRFESRRTSSGEVFSQTKYTAAHKTLPLNTIVKVTNHKNGRSVFVKINDRCAKNGIIDLSKVAAKKINLFQTGTTTVSVEVLGNEYRKIWEQQSDMYSMFEKNNMSEDMQQRYIDSLLNSNGTQISFPIAYYIRIAIVDGKTAANKLVQSVPEEFKNKVKSEKIYNENFYYVTIGPFATKEDANLSLIYLKRLYPSAHLIKKKGK